MVTDSGIQDMYKQTQVADEASTTSGAVSGVGLDIVKCYTEIVSVLCTKDRNDLRVTSPL